MEDHRRRTAYLGPEASFSHQAAVEALPHTEAVPLPSFKAILRALQESGSKDQPFYDYAVLPVENSTNGSVVQALDLLAQCGLDQETSTYPDIEVVDEHYLEVHHCLFVSRAWAAKTLDEVEFASLLSETNDNTHDTTTNGAGNGQIYGHRSLAKAKLRKLEYVLEKLSVKTLYTHPQVWGQCNNILSALLPPGHVERIDTSSTSAAAAYVAGTSLTTDAGVAAISSSLAGAKHGKEVICIARNIEDEPGANTTRFLILQNRRRVQNSSLRPSPNAQEDAPVKSLWTFTIAHHIPGSLATTLAVFAKHGFNLSAIQSRPRPKGRSSEPCSDNIEARREQDRNWKYVFFVECLFRTKPEDMGSVQTEPLNLLQDLKSVTEQVSLLGSWRNRLS